MSSASIKINFDNAKSQASELEEIAGKLSSLADGSLEDILNAVSSNWKSEHADSYLKKGCQVQNDIKEISKELTRTASSIRRIAKTTYDAEMAALTLARTRKS